MNNCRNIAFLNIILLFCATLFLSCSKTSKPELTPWGTIVGEDSTAQHLGAFNLDDIINQGEIIMLSVTGPDTYYDYHGHGMGKQFLLLENFAKELGVKVRVEVCKDSSEMVSKLLSGEGDLIANPLSVSVDGLVSCGPQWVAKASNTSLVDTLNRWYRPELLAKIETEQKVMLANGGVQRRVYSPMLNRAQGVISKYDDLFIRHSAVARLDWRLLAAQCYQESCFDPRAHSWAGACGLMQIIPSTAAHLGLSMADIYNPEANIAAAARYMRELQSAFCDIPNHQERIKFALAAYNGGVHHIRDAQALARKNGHNDKLWRDVADFVLKLQQPQYFQDPIVRYGYMRGSETVDYVSRIHSRWQQYCGSARPAGVSGSVPAAVPHASRKKHRFG